MAQFEKGHKKIGGRRKGVPNQKRTIFESLEEIKTQDGIPIDVVKMFFQALQATPPCQQVDALLGFMKFLYPQQRNLEVSQPEGEGFIIKIEDYTSKSPNPAQRLR